MPKSVGPFGWVSPLLRWANGDVKVSGQEGPIPPPRGFVTDPTDRDLYTGLLDGWMSSTVGASLSSFFSEPRSRKELYILFERMDMTDYAGSVLDLFSEDATQASPETGKSVWFTGPEAIVAMLDDMAERLELENEILPLTRETAKFGDCFNRLIYASGMDGGVRRLIPTPPLGVTRDEDKEGRLRGYRQEGRKFKNGNSDVSYPWDFVHFRLRGRDRRYPYGTSVLFNGMRPWRELICLADWALGYQLGKHPDRNLFLIDGGGASETEQVEAGRKFAMKLKKNLLIDPSGLSGKNAETKSNPWSALEDMVMVVDRESNTRVERIAGSGNALDIAPLKMLEQRFYAACRCSSNFIGTGDPINEPFNPKASLTNQDIRYARAVKRLQSTMRAGIRYLSELNLMLLMSPGTRDGLLSEDVIDSRMFDWRLEGNDFKVNMAPIGFLEELERLEVMQTRQQVALAMSELANGNQIYDIYEFTAYILQEICQIPEERVQTLLRQDLENQHMDNIRAGLLPNGDSPSAVKESMQRMAKGRVTGTLNHKDKKLLSEAIESNPKIREAIYKIKRTTETTERDVPYTGVLPGNELIEKGYMTDGINETELAAILEDAKKDFRPDVCED